MAAADDLGYAMRAMTVGKILWAFEPHGLDLPGWGRLAIPDEGTIRVELESGGRWDFPAERLLSLGGDLVGWFEPERGVAVLGSKADDLLRLDLTSADLALITSLRREASIDLRFTSFREVADRVLCVYEAGLLCMDEEGHLQWTAEHDQLGIYFEGVKDGVLWFSAQWPPELAGYRLAFELATGKKVMG